MAFDASLILHGEYSDALVDCDENDTVAVSLTVNADGNGVIDVRKTGLSNPMCAVLILTEEADSDAYDDVSTITIEESEFLDRGWQTVTTFPVLYSHIAKVYITATTAFVALDQTTPRVLTETSSNDSGAILFISEELFTVDGQGYCLVERDAAGDVFDEAVGQVLTATSGTGVGTKTKATELGVSVQMQPGIFVRKFHTNKRYVRCNCEALEDNIGKIWIMLTNDHAAINTDLGC